MQNSIISLFVPKFFNKIFDQMVTACTHEQLELIEEGLFLMQGVMMEVVLVVPTEHNVEHAEDELVPSFGERFI
jgi:hypothetical protein